MKVGDYVRFDYHRISVPIQIAKITEVHYDITNEDDNVCYSTDVGLVISESNLVKESSTNIMDLIEVGDYVNGCEVLDIFNYNNCDSHLIVNGNGFNVIMINDIKSIVTKEQFESIQYKVGE